MKKPKRAKREKVEKSECGDDTSEKLKKPKRLESKLPKEGSKAIDSLISPEGSTPREVWYKKKRLWPSYVIGLLALCVSATHMYRDHFYKDNSFDLMISGFNIVKCIDPSGAVAGYEYMTIDLAFINSGNQHQSVLGAKFVLPGGEVAGFSTEHWSMRFDRTVTEPFSVAPGRTEVVHLVQPIDDKAILGRNRTNADSTNIHCRKEFQIIAIEVSAITASGLPGESSFPIVRMNTTEPLRMGFYGDEELENPAGGVVYQRNFLDSLTIGRQCFQDRIRFIPDL